MKAMEFHVLSHTHWDREWYLPFQQFRRMLVHLMDDLLEILEKDKDFKHFHLDGQSIILEDYLAVRPERKMDLQRFAKAGRLSVGPWYVLSDSYLVHGESTIRNLYIGHQIASGFSEVCKAGYLPDQFGNISQLPQIFQGFGIKQAVFGRGYFLKEGRTSEIEWTSPDGSSVFALHLTCWYNNFQRPPSDVRQAAKQVRHLRDFMKQYITAPCLLLMNGVDHINVQPDIGQIVKKLNRHFKGDKVIHTDLESFLKQAEKGAKELTPVNGELREDNNNQVLSGTLSSRIYLKQANYRCENALLSAETMHAMAVLNGAAPDRPYLMQAWKKLIENHPHDSICGCSIDQVHREMMPRFDQVEQMAAALSQEAMEYIATNVQLPHKKGETALLVVNPTAIPRREVLDLTIDIPLTEPMRDARQLEVSGRIPQYISIVDEKAQPVPFEQLKNHQRPRPVFSPDELPRTQIVQSFQAQIPVELGPLEYQLYRIQPRKGKSVRPTHRMKGGNNRLENEMVQVMVGGDGSISIRDKVTGHLYGPMLIFDDGGDIGDEYNYVCPENDRTITTEGRPAQIRPVNMTPFQGTLQIERLLPLPETADLNDGRRVRNNLDCLISTRITLKAGDPTLYCETRLENRSSFHRLRVIFQSNLSSEKTWADSPFDIIERPAAPPEEWKGASRQSPLHSFCTVESEEQQGLALFSKGLHEYRLTNTETGTLALTLLRCVGHISRGGEASFSFETPEAQCLGIHRFEYALHPYHGQGYRDLLPRLAEAYSRPVATHQFEPQKGKLSRKQALLSVEPECVLPSAVKMSEERDTVMIRLVNPSREEVQAAIKTGPSLKEVHILDMLENRQKKVTSKRTGVEIPMKPGQILTLELVF